MLLLRPGLRALPKLSFSQSRRTFLSTAQNRKNEPTKLTEQTTATPAPATDEHPILQQYRKVVAEREQINKQASAAQAAGHQRFGDLADSSVFKSAFVRDAVGRRPTGAAVTDGEGAHASYGRASFPAPLDELDVDALSTALDPEPRRRQAWERRQAIRVVRRRGRLTKAERLARTERSVTINSPLWDTSVKKLMLLARQISGRPIEDAIVQMHFSKKVKNGRRIKEFLEFVRDKAVASAGMGLGLGNPVPSGYAGFDSLYPPQSAAEIEAEMEKFQPAPEGPVVIRDKNNKKIKIANPKGMYLARVWIVRGPYTKEMHFRSRHRATYLRHPSARLFVTVKEEVTRIRESNERQARKGKQKLWVQLQDKPISAQNQQILW